MGRSALVALDRVIGGAIVLGDRRDTQRDGSNSRTVTRHGRLLGVSGGGQYRQGEGGGRRGEWPPDAEQGALREGGAHGTRTIRSRALPHSRHIRVDSLACQ